MCATTSIKHSRATLRMDEAGFYIRGSVVLPTKALFEEPFVLNLLQILTVADTTTRGACGVDYTPVMAQRYRP